MHSPSSDEVDQPPSQMLINQLTSLLAARERELERVSQDCTRQTAAPRSMEAQYRVAKSCVHSEKVRKEECQASLQRQISLQECLQREHETELSLLRAYLDDKQDTIARHATPRSPACARPVTPLVFLPLACLLLVIMDVATILRSFASQETPSVAVLQALNDELTLSLPSDPAVAAGPQLSEPRTSDAEDAPMLAELPAPSPADSALPRTSDQPAAEPSPAGPVLGHGSTQETSLAREKASDLEVADPPSDLTAPLPIQSVLPAPPSSSGDQPPDSLVPSAPPLLAPPSSTLPTLELPSADLAFEASWRLPSEIDPAYASAADPSPIFRRVDFYGDLATSWQSANRQFWESNSPLEELDQIARSLVATCSASLSAVQRAAELQRENAALKARLRELEHLTASSAPPEPSLGSLDAYLRAVGESAASARAISHAAFDKLQQLEAALKTSESSLASEADRHQATLSELKAKEAELLSQSEELTLLRQGQELLQTGLADAQALASAAAGREATMWTQWEACQATLQSLQAELSKAQEAVSQGQSDLSVARAEAAENKNSLELALAYFAFVTSLSSQ
ncbi:uncharacterized protein LOC121972870 [Zingiber officinale]|uniref:uncharacterized protein LOC121972870 n=1 Tax=Zingiber officinale TaxID=94328 RepID=UPI001C4AEF6B|nr:uncharacterized protein LOC121972870 [Zingiber officinale]